MAPTSDARDARLPAEDVPAARPAEPRVASGPSTLDAVAWALGAAALAHLFVRNNAAASRLADGARVYFLDDDAMISMRYARNLAEGHGLVWNPGERVEGYTNFLWTLVMAAVHRAGAGDAHASAWVRVVAWVLLSAGLAFGVVAVRALAPRAALAVPVFVAAFVGCKDVVLWSAWGYETTLLIALELGFLAGLLRGTPRSRALGFVALALVPLARSDGLVLFAACAAGALALAHDRRRALLHLAGALAPALAHLVLRRAYYGEWLPNTYYLKVHGLDGAFARGVTYSRGFLLAYAVPLLVALGAAARLGRRGVVLLATLGLTLAYVTRIGGDMMGPFRFYAHVMPVAFVFAAAASGVLASGAAARATWAAVLLAAVIPLDRTMEHLVGVHPNGDPFQQLRVAMLLKRNAAPESRVAVIAAGIVPYFTRMPAVDLLGKTDAHVARLRPVPGANVAHGKIDPEHSLGTKGADLVVTHRAATFPAGLVEGTVSPDPLVTLLASRRFVRDYRDHPVTDPFLLRDTAVYARAGSPEDARRTRWVDVDVRP